MHAIETLLISYRAAAISERDKGTAFEKLIKAWLVKDPVQALRFQRVQTWAEWAADQGQDRNDTGIDLVAMRHDSGFTAIQCKFVAPNARISKQAIDSFISASAKPAFSERIIVETTTKAWSPNAETMLQGQAIPTTRIGLQDLIASDVDWTTFAGTGEIQRREPRTLRPDQVEALNAVRTGLTAANRGKLIMACGTGKTLTALRIAEDLAGPGKQVLFLMPSLALMAQSVREWCADATLPLATFAVCSDAQVGKRRRSTDDIAELEVTDLTFPVTTDVAKVAKAIASADPQAMRIVFGTYQSIQVIADAQAKHSMADFDLIVCDEAHRTTGATLSGEDQSNFVKVHDNAVIAGRKRIYMTATPRIYGEGVKSKARDVKAVLASMDDEKLYGKVLFHSGFARAVESGILSDYRVIVLAMDEGYVSTAVQKRLKNEDSELVLDDATKIIGCWKALSKSGLEQGPDGDPAPMRRALAFCRDIKSSKLVRDEFEHVVSEFQAQSETENGNAAETLQCAVRHVDGTYNARARGQRLDWLKADAGIKVCRILSNARCLAEGVDVPALDAILFLHPRKSQIDVVQSVGRVMRRAPGKRMGYVILPVGVPPGVAADQALNDNRKYQVVWQILNALRAHDERLDGVINQGGLGQDVNDRITIIDGRPASTELRAVTAEVDTLPVHSKPDKPDLGETGADPPQKRDEPRQLELVMDEFSRAIMAKIVEKCGTRDYWEDWATDVADIAERHITRIEALVSKQDSDARGFFLDFLTEVRDDLNESISERDAIEMLAQHIITRPVFDSLFEGYAFVDRNPVSVAMQEVLGVIDEAHVDKEAQKLAGFYASVRRRAAGITEPQARQKLIVELYDKFFRTAFPRTTNMLGIVYTPTAVVDFIIRSVDDVLRSEFGQTLGSKGVHIIDPFTGTGTFITRLLQSGLIEPEDLERKYREEIHANEIVLLAYYIAAINIETVFHALTKREDYLPFDGICFTDTFGMHEGDDLLSFYMHDNSNRRTRQKQTKIKVIVGNPPYSAGQRSANENAQNVKYPKLDARVEGTYAEHSQAINKNSLYDSYIRAIRWASDRIGDSGVIAYVTNAGWIDSNSADGLRKCLAEEFSSLYVFHLRGNARTQGEQRRKEKDNVFGQGSRAPIAITLLVRNPKSEKRGQIHFHDIGDYLSQVDKLRIVTKFGSTQGITERDGWRSIQPDENHDWLNQVDTDFDQFPALGDKRSQSTRLFKNYSCGIKTQRDAWCYNASKSEVDRNIRSMIAFYHSERARYQAGSPPAKPDTQAVSAFINSDPTRISWTRALKQDFARNKDLNFHEGEILQSAYRPFSKQWMYYGRRLNEMVYQMPQIFPNAQARNKVICVTGVGATAEFSTLIVNAIPNLHTLDSGQCFPLYLYERIEASGQPDLFDAVPEQIEYRRRDGISDAGLEHFHAAYPGKSIDKQGLFHYVYGLLHSEDYRERFRNNLMKQIPRIPTVATFDDFEAFRYAGEKLAKLHLGYESVDPWPVTINDCEGLPTGIEPQQLYRVEKMKVASKDDPSRIIYNPHITISGIPLEAYDYVVNGKPAIKWVMERQGVRTDKASGIVNNANLYAVETMGDPRYPLDLLLRVITVSVETMRIVRSLPSLKID